MVIVRLPDDPSFNHSKDKNKNFIMGKKVRNTKWNLFTERYLRMQIKLRNQFGDDGVDSNPLKQPPQS